MKIIVLSDTHMPKRAKELPDRLTKELKEADLIIHAGDWQTLEVYHQLASFGKVAGVYGNVDGEDIQTKFPDKLMIEEKGFKIGVVHGHGTGKTTEKRALEAFKGEQLDCIIFGHSHIPVHKYDQGILLLNPGSPTDKRRQKQYSFGILHVNDTLQAELIFFDK
ncbi:metallophosphoesterase family protein [Neobacillus sp. Marseille-QA0830]